MTAQQPPIDLEDTLLEIDRVTSEFVEFLESQNETLMALVRASGEFSAVGFDED